MRLAVLLIGGVLAAGCTKRVELARSPFMTPLPEGKRPANAAPADAPAAGPADPETLATDSAAAEAFEEAYGPDGKPKIRPASRNAEEARPLATEQAHVADAPGSAAAQLGLARAYHREKIHDLALRHYEKARELDPASSEIGRDIGRLWVDDGAPGLALPYLEEATRRMPEDALAWSYRGIALDMLSRYPEAEEALRRAAALEPGRWDFANNLGYNLFLQERYPEAAAELARGLEHAPGEPALLNNLGFAVGFQGMPDSAFVAFRAAGPEGPAWNNLGVVHRYLGNAEPAAEAFARAARLDPGSREIAANLREARRRLSDERALETMSAPAPAAPESVDAGASGPPAPAPAVGSPAPAVGSPALAPVTAPALPREAQPARVGARLNAAADSAAPSPSTPGPEGSR